MRQPSMRKRLPSGYTIAKGGPYDGRKIPVNGTMQIRVAVKKQRVLGMWAVEHYTAHYEGHYEFGGLWHGTFTTTTP